MVAVAVAGSDFDRDLAAIDARITELDRGDGPRGADEATRLANAWYHRASITGSFADYRAVAGVVRDALADVGPWPDLCLLEAHLGLHFHRLAVVRRSLAAAEGLAGSPEGRALLADVAVQEGRYEDARRTYEEVLGEDRSWHNLLRLADLEAAVGRDATAERLYADAVEELSAKELRSYALVELRWGRLHLSRGRNGEADRHYERACRAYTGWWRTDEHVAELRAAQGRVEEALELLERVYDATGRPEVAQALGDLLARDGREGEAAIWHGRALTAYLESADRGEIHYLHHLAELYADALGDGEEAVRWARKDVELRPGPATRATLARALRAAGRTREAEELALDAGTTGRALHLHH